MPATTMLLVIFAKTTIPRLQQDQLALLEPRAFRDIVMLLDIVVLAILAAKNVPSPPAHLASLVTISRLQEPLAAQFHAQTLNSLLLILESARVVGLIARHAPMQPPAQCVWIPIKWPATLCLCALLLLAELESSGILLEYVCLAEPIVIAVVPLYCVLFALLTLI